MTITQKDRAILCELAKQQMELANSKRNQELYRLWCTTGGKQQERTMIRIELGTFEHEILPNLMQCEGEMARRMEVQLRKPMVNFTMFEDDELVPDYYGVSIGSTFTPFGLPVKRQETGGVGHHFIPYLHDLEEDEHLLGKSVWSFNEEETAAHEAIAQDVFGDILPVKRMSNAAYCTPMQDIVHIMNMDDMYMAMYDDEERYIRIMDRRCQRIHQFQPGIPGDQCTADRSGNGQQTLAHLRQIGIHHRPAQQLGTGGNDRNIHRNPI